MTCISKYCNKILKQLKISFTFLKLFTELPTWSSVGVVILQEFDVERLVLERRLQLREGRTAWEGVKYMIMN